jgi:hypothetical protein
MRSLPKSDSKPLGLIWVDWLPLVVITSLVRALGKQARVHLWDGTSRGSPFLHHTLREWPRRPLGEH